MSAFLNDIKATRKGDSLHGTMFEVNGDVMLDPLAANPEETRFTTLLVAALKRGVDVRILVNNNIYIQTGITTGFCAAINAHCANGGDCCIPDSRVAYNGGGPGGSIHAKTWAIQYPNETVAYVGSTDIIGDRWDTSKHDDSPARERPRIPATPNPNPNPNPPRPEHCMRREPADIIHFHGWYGNMFRLRGGSAVDVARHFWLIWNDPTPLPLGMGLIYTLKPYPWRTPPQPSSPVGNLTVQTVRPLTQSYSQPSPLLHTSIEVMVDTV